MSNLELTGKTRSRRRRLATLGILALALVTAFCMTLGGSAEAKKKKKAGPSVFQASVSPNSAVPDDQATGPSIPLTSTITVGKKFKGKQVADVNVTGIQTTGNSAGAANDLGFRLTAPNGTNVLLIDPGIGDVSIGPLTLDDDTPVSICNATTPPCSYTPQTLNRPFAGTANLLFLASGGTGPLSAFDGSPMRGTWTLTVWDESNVGQTSLLNSWGLKITAARPVT
jgi:subtilisin-like proprotein convertase family protein